MNKNEYARANKEWLAEKGKEEGVTRLAKGVCYKVLQSGSEGGKQPTPSSVVSCHYLGRTIDGKCFDTSLGGYPLAIRLRDLIEGWVIALLQMRVGDKWEKEIAMPDMEGKEYAVEYCKFAPRCPYATDECRQKRPDAKDMGNGRMVLCCHPLCQQTKEA